MADRRRRGLTAQTAALALGLVALVAFFVWRSHVVPEHGAGPAATADRDAPDDVHERRRRTVAETLAAGSRRATSEGTRVVLTVADAGRSPPDAGHGAPSPWSKDAVVLTVVNRRDTDVELLWHDFDGAEQSRGRLHAGERRTVPSYVGHVWTLRLVDPPTDLTTFTARAGLVVATPPAQ